MHDIKESDPELLTLLENINPAPATDSCMKRTMMFKATEARICYKVEGRNLPGVFFIDEANAGPTAVDGIPTLFHCMTINIAPAKTRASTKPDRTMIAIVLKSIPWLLLAKFAVSGSPLVLSVGAPSTMSSFGEEEGIPEAKSTSSKRTESKKKGRN